MVEFLQIIALQSRFTRWTLCCLASIQRRDHAHKQI